MFIFSTWGYFICGTIARSGFATFFAMPCVKFGLDEKYIYNICLIVASHAL
jgi:hypothetical protein